MISKPLVVGLGEVLWDLLPDGPRMGGAPANFACHAKALGANAVVVSRVGDDDRGKELVAAIAEHGVDISTITIDPVYPTGIASATLDDEGKANFSIQENVAWDHLTADRFLLDRVAEADAICYGTLAQRSTGSAAAIQKLLDATRPDCLRVFDVNLRQQDISKTMLTGSLERADVVKLNDEELPRVAQMFGINGNFREIFDVILSQFNVRVIVYTRGSEGSIIYDGDLWVEHPGFPTKMIDTVGAGDSFVATVTMGLLKGWSLTEISEVANQVAAHVCSHAGAVPPLPEPVRRKFSE